MVASEDTADRLPSNPHIRKCGDCGSTTGLKVVGEDDRARAFCPAHYPATKKR
jgi:hypothetical protein